jgi:hypothetical protein
LEESDSSRYKSNLKISKVMAWLYSGKRQGFEIIRSH